jgi:hypothetical protein
LSGRNVIRVVASVVIVALAVRCLYFWRFAASYRNAYRERPYAALYPVGLVPIAEWLRAQRPKEVFGPPHDDDPHLYQFLSRMLYPTPYHAIGSRPLRSGDFIVAPSNEEVLMRHTVVFRSDPLKVLQVQP